jgi:hypothetical protein
VTEQAWPRQRQPCRRRRRLLRCCPISPTATRQRRLGPLRVRLRLPPRPKPQLAGRPSARRPRPRPRARLPLLAPAVVPSSLNLPPLFCPRRSPVLLPRPLPLALASRRLPPPWTTLSQRASAADGSSAIIHLYALNARAQDNRRASPAWTTRRPWALGTSVRLWRAFRPFDFVVVVVALPKCDLDSCWTASQRRDALCFFLFSMHARDFRSRAFVCFACCRRAWAGDACRGVVYAVARGLLRGELSFVRQVLPVPLLLRVLSSEVDFSLSCHQTRTQANVHRYEATLGEPNYPH